jgi:phosphoribosyl 1,2-cyclic phosphate phosphodiesterase
MTSANTFTITVLGSGTSMGVPTLGCHCPVCESKDPRDNRLRPSLLLSRNTHNVIIDTTPDFRQQALRAGLDRLDAVLLTHGHADHILGFDDIRPYNIRQRQPMPVYGNEETFDIIRRAFAYAFEEKPAQSTVPRVDLHPITGPIDLIGLTITPIPLIHGTMKVLGFRFGRAAYLTDFSSLPESSAALLRGLDELIIDALRDVPHPMHQTVQQALALIDQLKPARAWFTHISHDLPHEETNQRLCHLGYPQVQMAYDGLQLEVAIPERVHRPAAPIVTKSRTETLSPVVAQHAAPVSPRAEGHERSAPATFTSAESWSTAYASTARGSVLTIGNLDGIHLGHQAILRAIVERAAKTGAVATALTFEPSPRKILRPESAPLQLSTRAQRQQWFAEAGLEAVVILPFTLELSKLTPEQFVEQILVRNLHVGTILVGENFRFGHQQAGNVDLLITLGQKHNFEVAVIPPVTYRGEIVSSTAIRRDIANGSVSHASRLLGRPFVLTGEIVSGTGTGRKFTFPTLNLNAEQELLPARGVYITRTLLEGEQQTRPSVTNVGTRPTFNGTAQTVETHLLDFTAGFSPNRMQLQFCKRLRPEKKFAGPDDLRAQIAADIRRARQFFSRLRSRS